MTYPDDGHVEPGGSSLRRLIRLPDGIQVEIRKLSVGPMDNNAYLIANSGEALLIDAANDAERLLAEIDDLGAQVTTIFTTHGHADHWQALDDIARATGAMVILHPDDQPMLPRRADHHVRHNDVLPIGQASVTFLHTPGHTPGSTCVLLAMDHLFTGDTLFPGGPGNTFGNDQAFRTIMNSLDERLFVLPDTTWVYPGHGHDTTLGAERPSVEEWLARGW